MNTLKSLHLCFLFISVTAIYNVFGAEFNYDDPNTWLSNFPTCNGDRQSPIALSYSEAIKVRNGNSLRFHHYSEILSSTNITNNGHSASVTIGATNLGNRPAISGAGLTGRYVVEGFHFHWGEPTNRKGSEHTINGNRYAIEMHIVHRSDQFSTLAEALANQSGVAVISLLYEEVQSLTFNAFGLSTITNALPHIRNNTSSRKLGQFALQSLFSTFRQRKYFAYDGSLTTPPCTQGVTHLVIDAIQQIQSSDLKNFYILRDERDEPLLNTYRPLQNRDGRRITYRLR